MYDDFRPVYYDFRHCTWSYEKVIVHVMDLEVFMGRNLVCGF